MRLIFLAALIVMCFARSTMAEPAVTRALNELRATAGQAPATFSAQLAEAATRHAEDMLQARIFSHTGSDGSTVADRVSATGYGWCYVAENIAQGQPDLSEVMEAWAGSPAHRRNMLSPDVTEFALVAGRGAIWVMVLARPGC